MIRFGVLSLALALTGPCDASAGSTPDFGDGPPLCPNDDTACGSGGAEIVVEGSSVDGGGGWVSSDGGRVGGAGAGGAK